MEPSAWSLGTSTAITRKSSTYPSAPPTALTLGAEPAGDRGQPTHFYPRRQRFLFRVVVPKDWDKQQKVIWTLDVARANRPGQGMAAAGMGTQPGRDRREHGRRRPGPEQQTSVPHHRRCSDRCVAGRSDADCLGHRRRSSETVPAHPFEPGPRFAASPPEGRADQMDSVPRTGQSHVRSGSPPRWCTENR